MSIVDLFYKRAQVTAPGRTHEEMYEEQQGRPMHEYVGQDDESFETDGRGEPRNLGSGNRDFHSLSSKEQDALAKVVESDPDIQQIFSQYKELANKMVAATYYEDEREQLLIAFESKGLVQVMQNKAAKYGPQAVDYANKMIDAIAEAAFQDKCAE